MRVTALLEPLRDRLAWDSPSVSSCVAALAPHTCNTQVLISYEHNTFKTSVADPDPELWDPYVLGLLDPDPVPLVRGTDPCFCDFFTT